MMLDGGTQKLCLILSKATCISTDQKESKVHELYEISSWLQSTDYVFYLLYLIYVVLIKN